MFLTIPAFGDGICSFSKLGVPIKTTISATVLEDALNGTVTVRPLPLGRPTSDKVVIITSMLSCPLTYK